MDFINTLFLLGGLLIALSILGSRLSSKFVGFKPALSLATLGVLLTSGSVGFLAMWVFDLSVFEGLLIGAIVGSTDAAAVFSMLSGRGINLNERVGATLEIESGTNDPMAIFLTIMLVEVLVGEIGAPLETILFFVQQFGFGLIIGIGGGWLIARLLSWLDLAPGLYAMLALALGFSVFGLTGAVGGSGFLAIYLCGLMIGNRPGRHLNFILPVHDGLAWLSQIGLFLILGLLVNPSELLQYALPALVIALALIFVARPIAVVLSVKPFFRFRWREIGFISWVGLRGAVPIVLAIFPVIGGVENASLYFNVAFVVVLLSLLIQGSTLSLMARWMRVEVPVGIKPNHRGALGILPQNDYELFVYRIENEQLDGQPIRLIRFPSGTLISALFRNHVMLHPKGSTELKLNDTICVISRNEDLDALNQIFSGHSKLKQKEAFFGSFNIRGDALLSDVAKAYGLVISSAEYGMTVSDFISRRVGGHPVVGDDVDWHGIHWVVNEVEGDKIIKIGLRLY